MGKRKAWRLRGRCTGEENIKKVLKNGKTGTEVIWLMMKITAVNIKIR